MRDVLGAIDHPGSGVRRGSRPARNRTAFGRRGALIVIAGLVVAVGAGSRWGRCDVPLSGAGQPAPAGSGPTDIQVPPPPFSEGIFPCSECHKDITPNPQPRKLVDAHDEIELHHGDRDRWCFDCHNPDNRDKLRLASGRLIDFSESYVLCGQCHGDKYRDWKVGVHGKRTGQWNGAKQYLLCVNCHNPHSPHFKPLKPLPPPLRPVGGMHSEGTKP